MSFFSFSGGSSPPKRPLNAKSPPIIPFCTSPSQLEEVTLDQESIFSNTMGLRSPGGPTRGRSVKEIEEQLSNLKKENFNLKLRIYFLEEKMGTNFTLDKDNVVKKYIELQVEYSNLQKELQEKHELLCQAVRAMELEDDEHKKFVAAKEEQLNMCQQEIEDLRMQLQDTKFDSDGLSLKSDTTGFYSSRATNSGNLVAELQEKIKILETELQLEKENNASLQFIIGQAETLKTRYENMQKESLSKDETIKNLHDEIDSANKKILEFSRQMKDVQEKLDTSYRENQSLHKKILNENRKLDDIVCQMNELKKKYACAKTDLEREHKRAERSKMASEMRNAELEKENEKQKAKIRDLQGKLETALVEIRKNQNLAVSKSPAQMTNTPNTDVAFISVQNAAASAGVAEANPLHVQVTPVSKRSSSSSSWSVGLPSPVSPSPETFDAFEFEEMLLKGAGEMPGADEILSKYRALKHEFDAQRQRLIKVKTEQFTACKIIKSMVDSRNKAKEEIAELRRHVEELEHELESVVSKPTSDGEVPATAVTTSRRRRLSHDAGVEEVRAKTKNSVERFGKFHFPE